MNKADRKQIADLQAAIHLAKAAIENAMQPALTAAEELGESLEGTALQIEEIKEAEQEKLDNMPEGLAAGEKGEAMTTAIDHLDNGQTLLEEAKEALEELTEAANQIVAKLDEAVEALDNAAGE